MPCCIFEASLGTGHTVPHCKAFRYGKEDSRGQSCGSTLYINEDVLKSRNLLYKQGFVDSQFGTTVHRTCVVNKACKSLCVPLENEALYALYASCFDHIF